MLMLIYGREILTRKPGATFISEVKCSQILYDELNRRTKARHDPCVLPRAVPIVEAMVHLVLADHLLRHRGQVGV